MSHRIAFAGLLLILFAAGPVVAQRYILPREISRIPAAATIENYGSATFWSPRFTWNTLTPTGPFDPSKRRIACSGSLPTGLRVTYGTYVHSLQLACASVVNGALATGAAYSSSTALTSGPGAHTSPAPRTSTLSCPAGQVLLGIGIRSGSYVDAITEIRCAVLNADLRTLGATSQRAVSAGGTGGRTMTLQCPLHHAMSMLETVQGWYIDGLMIDCRQFRPAQ